MDRVVDDIDSRLARRLKLEREARGWSLAEVAGRSGVSKAMISKIERGEVSPTAALLARLASAFGLTLSTLLLRAEQQAGRISRAADQMQWTDPATGYVRRQILVTPEHPIELVEVSMPAGGRVDFPASTYALIRQVVLVQAGELIVIEGGERHCLAAGDCLAFGPPSDVTIANESSEPCRYLVALDRR